MITGSASSPTRPNACLMFGSADPVTPEVRVTPREQAGGTGVRGRPADPRPVVALVEARSVRVSQRIVSGPRRAAVPRRTAEQRTADAAAGSMNKLVQVQVCPGASRGASSDEAGDLPVDPGRDPHIASSDVLRG